MCGQAIHAGRESTEIMNQSQAELLYVFVTKITHRVNNRKAPHWCAVEGNTKQRAEPGHMHGNDGIPLDPENWGISYWSAACDPLGGRDKRRFPVSNLSVY